MVLHFITISEGGGREILYLRPLSEYSKGGDTGRTDKPDPTRDPSSQSQKCSDEFDELILKAVRMKYSDAKPSFRLIYSMEVVEKVVTRYKGRLLKYLNKLDKRVPKASVLFVPSRNDLSPCRKKDLPSSGELDVVDVCDTIGEDLSLICDLDELRRIDEVCGTKVIEDHPSLSCGLDELRRIDGICKKAIRVSFVKWFNHYSPSVERKHSEEERHPR